MLNLKNTQSICIKFGKKYSALIKWQDNNVKLTPGCFFLSAMISSLIVVKKSEATLDMIVIPNIGKNLHQDVSFCLQ